MRLLIAESNCVANSGPVWYNQDTRKGDFQSSVRRARAPAAKSHFPRRMGAMREKNRREFLADVGRGMLVASVGASVAHDLGLSSALADEGAETLLFGTMEPLVALMQETPVHKLLPRL